MRKLIFLRDCVRFADSNESVRARRQEWDLIRAMLAREDRKIHWIDGFLIFPAWRDKEQKKDYPAQFMVIANRATKELANIGFGAKIVSIERSGGYWALERSAKRKYETNIEEAMRLLKKSDDRFVLGDDSGWALVIEAAKEWAEPRALCRAIVQAQKVPHRLGTQQGEELGRITALIEDHRSDLVNVILKVADKASKERQSLNFKNQIVCGTLVKWMVEIAETNEAIDILSDKVVAAPALADEETRTFVRLATALADCTREGEMKSYNKVGSEAVVMPEEDDRESEDLLERLSTCGFVLRVIKSVEEYFEQIGYLRIRPGDVQANLKTAIFSFTRRCRKALDSHQNVESLFHQHLRRCVRAERMRAGLGCEVFDATDKDDSEKKKALQTLLFNVVGKTNLKDRLVQEAANVLFGIGTKNDVSRDRRGVRATLAGDLCDFTGFIEDRTRDFVGRKNIFDRIDEFVEGNLCGYFLVTGDPGIGKSSLAAQLVKEKKCIHHFNIRATGVNTANTFLKNVCAQLIIKFHLAYTCLPAESYEDGGFLETVLGEVSERLGANEKVLVIIDALDEVSVSTTGRRANTLFLPFTLPRGIFIILTSRRQPLNLRIECAQEQLDIEHDCPENMDDIKEYLMLKAKGSGIQSYLDRYRLNKSMFVERMTEKCQGNFMYLRYVLPEIETGAYKDLDFTEIPAGLQSYYEDHWRRMGMTDTSSAHDKIRVVYVLCEVLQPVSRSLILDFVREANPELDELMVQEILDEWRQFLHVQEVDGETQYSVYHTSFRDFLHRKDIVQAAGVSIEGINRMIADNLWRELFPDQDNKQRTRRSTRKPNARSARSSGRSRKGKK